MIVLKFISKEIKVSDFLAQGSDYMEIFIQGCNFNSVYRVEKIAII